MFLTYFTEQPYIPFPAEAALAHDDDDHPARRLGDTILLFSNKHFDRQTGSRLYRERIEQFVLAEEVGFDGVMVNEHHFTAISMNHRCNIMSSVLAGVTKRVKIVQCGNILPTWDNPVQLAEEIAMIDLISGGRLVAGIVRGQGSENLANNVNPVHNRERFLEAHDLLIKTWTQPGPFRWEGEHYHQRVVNPWVLPFQKPHPRILISGVATKETIIFAAQHRYPYLVLSSDVESTKEIWRLYDQTASEAGYEAGPENHGYLMRIQVADTTERALADAAQFQWMVGDLHGWQNLAWQSPAGYTSWDSRQAQIKRNVFHKNTLEHQLEIGTIIAGTPAEVIPKIRMWLEETRPGSLMLWSNDGNVSNQSAMRCIELLGKEVLPAVREIGDELGLKSPFEANAPVSLTAGAMAVPESSVRR